MHELSIAREIIEIVKSYVPVGDRPRVTRVEVRIGQLQNVLVDSLCFCFSGIRELDQLDRAELIVEQVPVTVTCKACAAQTTIENNIYLCQSCRSADVFILGGNELNVLAIEVDD
jgi:hydrogenase nickel incorporation protein HypA/HybF